MALRHAPAAQRNRAPILEVLQRVLPAEGTVLEIASGTGEHIGHFAPALPGLQWIPSDPDAAQRASIRARIRHECGTNVTDPLGLDVLKPWPVLTVDAVITANLLHVSDSAALPALLEGAAGVLTPEGLLAIYGPFRRGGGHTSPGNRQFDEALRRENPAWGIRDVEAVEACAEATGFAAMEVVEMPANHLYLLYRWRGSR
jgi:cyclopropane fatty-acyl-phospholipid synthase-like methyltransferase